MQIIDDILQNSKKASLDKEKASEVDLDNHTYLEKLRKTSVENFLESIKTKALSDIKLEFEKMTDQYNSATKLYVDRKYKEK